MTQAGEIEAAARRFLASFTNLEWPPFISAFSETASVFFPFDDTPSRVDGIKRISHRFSEFFDVVKSERSGPDYLKLEPMDLAVQKLGNVGLVTFHLRDSSHLSRRTLVLVHDGESWKVQHLHASRIESAGRLPG